MSPTITPSEDKLYMTDDLEGRLDPATLEAPAVVHDEGPEPDFYESNSGLVFPVQMPELPPPPTATIFVIFANQESVALEGHLASLSFGHEGWLCSVSTMSKDIPAIVLKAAKEAVVAARVVLTDGSIEMITNVDCTASFSYGSASFTVTSDEARYV